MISVNALTALSLSRETEKIGFPPRTVQMKVFEHIVNKILKNKFSKGK